MEYSIQTISAQIKESYKIILLIVAGAIAIQLSPALPVEIFESFLVTRVAIVIFPLGASIVSFIVSKRYGGSKVFGKSYLALGISYFGVFLGEILYFNFDSIQNWDFSYVADIFFVMSYPAIMTHLVINIRYFKEKLENFQKTLLVVIPVGILATFSYLVVNTPSDFDPVFYYELIFVIGSSVTLSLAVVGFSIFRSTNLISAWFFILLGIFSDTVGSVFHRYTHTFGLYSYGDISNVLWIIAPVLIMYGLYRHLKSM